LPCVIIFLSALPPTARGADDGAQPPISKEESSTKLADDGNPGTAKSSPTKRASPEPVAPSKQAISHEKVEAISGNPGAVNIVTGTGLLGRTLGLDNISGVRLGGLWIGDANYLISGGVEPRKWSFNSLLLVDLSIDCEKLVGIPGGQFGAEFLQFNGQPTNNQAGAVQGYNSLVAAEPLVRTELYELWWRQQLFNDKLAIRVGKTVPTYDFGNVSRSVPTSNSSHEIASVSGLIYTPVFVNPTMLGVIPGYYDSAYGITVTFTPTKQLYIDYGLYDGSLARGVHTGLKFAPTFDGHYFNAMEVGSAWLLGPQDKPGTLALGGWWQTGKLYGPAIKENGAQGFYMFGSQRLWDRHPGVDSSGITGFFQFGINDSETLPANEYFGSGLTGFGLIPGRPEDSVGVGLAWSWLDRNLGLRSNEFMTAIYYQMHLVGSVFFQPTLSYVPNPGASRNVPGAVALTSRITVLF